MDIQQRLIGEADVAKYIGMSRIYLRRARCERNPNGPPFVKIGRAIRYDLADLDEWIAARKMNCR